MLDDIAVQREVTRTSSWCVLQAMGHISSLQSVVVVVRTSH